MTANNAPLPPLDPLRRYDVPTTLAYLDISRKTLYDDIKAGKLAIIKHGRRTYVPGSEIARLSRVS